MIQLTQEQRAALIADCEQSIALYKKNLRTWGQDWEEFNKSQLERQEIALAALTAKPVGYIHNFLNPEKSTGIFAKENRHYSRAVYTTPPVAALKLSESLIDEVCLTAAGIFGQSDPAKAQDIVNSIRKCLNATAPAEEK